MDETVRFRTTNMRLVQMCGMPRSNVRTGACQELVSRFESYGCWFGEIAGVQILESSVRREETMCSILKMLLGEARVLLPRESAADVNSDSTTLRAGPAVVLAHRETLQICDM